MTVNNQNNNLYSRGSEWRKWDLHVHPPGTKLSDGYKSKNGENIWDEFCDKIEQSDVKVFGITDYFSADGHHNFIKKFQDKYPNSKKKFFLNIELRLNETVNKALEEVNMHLIFNPTSVDKIDKFLSNLKVVKTGKDETTINCSELKTQDNYHSATVTREAIKRAFKETFGEKAIRQDHFLVFTAANNEGIRPERGKKRKEIISDEIDKFSDVIFGGTQNIEYFLKVERLEDREQMIGRKPVVAGSDAHSFEELNKFLGKRVIESDENNKEIIVKDITWIKADPAFEGLRQILYEPEPGERVWIGPAEPDKKNEYQVIRKIKFHNTNDFPDEIVFNKNLCSIIGSRSSGKSALLAYLAHSINPELAEDQNPKGPGDGFPWSKVDFNYSVEWNNRLSNEKSPGEIVYIPQNYLFEKSKDSDEVKKKIEPVLFKVIPDFEIKYKRVENDISTCNQKIAEQIETWFELSDLIRSLDEKLRGLGDKKVIEKEKKEIEFKMEILREKNQLSEEDVKNYQKISADISECKVRVKQIDTELSQIADVSEEQGFFSALSLMPIPTLGNLPKKLQDAIEGILQIEKNTILAKINKQVIDYKESIKKEEAEIDEKVSKIKKENNKLIEKYKKNIELGELVKKINEHNGFIKKIKNTEKDKEDAQKKLEECGKVIKPEIDQRKSLIEGLQSSIDNADQSAIEGIKFGIEYGFDNSFLEVVTQKVNVRDKSEFVEKNTLKIEGIREKPAEFLSAVYSGKQKINIGNDKKATAQEVLSLTEKILFTAKMEGDKIGGFSESTMTPGKRALFALRLILAESEDTWPLLIDQPEDDLDSRSIYDDIVPFLKKKKKERQIIMVSHNANLVIGSDSEQIIGTNRNGKDWPNADGRQFNYLTGSIEHTKEKEKKCKDTLKSQGIRQHACKILEGGKLAFEHRRNKYNLAKI